MDNGCYKLSWRERISFCCSCYSSCGEGILDIEKYVKLAEMVNPDMPMIIEHLVTDEEYAESVNYVTARLGLK